MAEAVGLFFGAASMLSLFKDCVDSFEYIDIGRGMERDYTTRKLKLDAAKLSLTRWGKSIGLDDDNKDKSPKELGLDGDAVDEAGYQLQHIQELFDNAKKVSDRFVMRTKKQNPNDASLALCQPSTDLKGTRVQLHQKMEKLSLERKGEFRKRDKLRWALHDAKEYERLITDISDCVKVLKEQFPAAQPKQKELAEVEVKEFKEIGDDAVPLVQKVALDSDTVLKEALAKVLSAGGRGQTSNTTNFYGDYNHGVQIGQQMGGSVSYNYGGASGR